MKIDPISNLDRAFIIRHLHDRCNWEGQRRGYDVRIVRFATRAGQRVQWSASKGTFIVAGEANTVGDAVRDINDLIIGRPYLVRHQSAPAPFVSPDCRRMEWLPYKEEA